MDKNIWPEVEAQRGRWQNVGRYRWRLARRGPERRWAFVWVPNE